VDRDGNYQHRCQQALVLDVQEPTRGHVRANLPSGFGSLKGAVSAFRLPVLSGAAAMIGNSRSIRLKEDYIEPSIIWTANIAPTGDGKSPVLQAATAPVRMREIGLIKKNKEADKTFEEASAKWEAKTKKERVGGEKPEKPALLTCWLDDATTEAVALRLKDNPRGALLPKDEFSHWFESMDQYHDRGGADVSRWLSIWTVDFPEDVAYANNIILTALQDRAVRL
jgi:hypothetical protein